MQILDLEVRLFQICGKSAVTGKSCPNCILALDGGRPLAKLTARVSRVFYFVYKRGIFAGSHFSFFHDAQGHWILTVSFVHRKVKIREYCRPTLLAEPTFLAESRPTHLINVLIPSKPAKIIHPK